ncbi:stage 0 sporulation protein YaaT [Gottschalkia purinilytica]|uniref:Stage 0 sporulation protein YaaT n=1 Tax=Gottschalkia purinilytica TaxID=1503 RepID=A0A0L0WED0_GOTPU|nr:stage 0 sporulation family protein [Gottschalkia purinilytica]KNF09824.1 stage 0 sporulation protein YaaT [Gottschalkia purinilytica]
MVTVVGIRFKKAGKIYYFDPDNIDVSKDDYAIVETARGVEFGQAVVGPKEVSEEEIVPPLKKVLRLATEEDIQKHNENKEKETYAFDICLKKIEEHGLDMKLIDVEYTFDNNKVIFYFTADGRVDFRELVKDLASIFKTRIELRQIGVRDEAKMIGGLGPCGKPLCCATFLGEFEPVSIKMAKEQNLSLNPTKISGICGRLMCCLKYEHETYEKILEKLPPVGATVMTPRGKGIVMETVTLLELAKVKVKGEDDTEEIVPFLIEEIELLEKANTKKDTKERTEVDITKIAKEEGIDVEDIEMLEDLLKED